MEFDEMETGLEAQFHIKDHRVTLRPMVWSDNLVMFGNSVKGILQQVDIFERILAWGESI